MKLVKRRSAPECACVSSATRRAAGSFGAGNAEDADQALVAPGLPDGRRFAAGHDHATRTVFRCVPAVARRPARRCLDQHVAFKAVALRILVRAKIEARAREQLSTTDKADAFDVNPRSGGGVRRRVSVVPDFGDF